MITFKIGFLLAFSLELNKPQKEKGHGKSKSETTKSTRSKKSKKSKDRKSDNTSKSSKSKKANSLVVLPDYVLDVGNPIGYAHIEYELIPKKQKQQIDIVCWKGVARVFAGENILTYRVKIEDNKAWVPVFVQHFVHQLDIEGLEKLHCQEINFKFYTNKGKLSSIAKGEKTKLFFLKEADVNKNDIAVPVFTENPNLQDIISGPSIVGYMEDIIKDCIYKPSYLNKDEIVTTIKISDPLQTVWMKKIVSKISNGEYMFFKEFTEVSMPPDEPDLNENNNKTIEPKKKIKDKKKKGKNKKETKEKEKNEKQKKKKVKDKKKKSEKRSKNNELKTTESKAGQMQIKVSGEVLFTDPNISMYDMKNPNEIMTNAYVLLGVEDLMTRSQEYSLNPMIVKIEKIENLDAEILKLNKFKSIFVRYNVPYVLQGKTLEREISEKVRFNEAHAHFTHKVSEAKFTEFVQSSRFLLEICGVREDNTENEINANIFGSACDDQVLSKRMTPEHLNLTLQNTLAKTCSTIEVLAVASYDLTSLLVPTWNFSSNESCHNPDNLLFQKPTPFQFSFRDNITTNSINLKALFRIKSRSPLAESSLIERGTSLKVEIYTTAPAESITNNIISRYNFYNRILLIIYDPEIASTLLNEILIRNQILSQGMVVPSDSDTIKNLFELESKYLTGFVIDNGNCFAFFLEGANKDEVKKIWERYKIISPNDMTIYFNTDLVFDQRLYIYFFKVGGLCILTLQKPLRDILAQELLYVEGNVPLPCLEAVKKLDMLFRCTTMKDILQFNLLPTPDELLSLDQEWGVPLRWNESLRKRIISNSKKKKHRDSKLSNTVF